MNRNWLVSSVCCFGTLAVAAIVALPGRTSTAATLNWQGNTLAGTWNTVGATGWDGGPPNAAGDVAQRVTALIADVDITQGVNDVTLGGVTIGNGTDLGNFYFEIDFAGGRVLNFDNGGSDATIVWDNPNSSANSQLWFGGAGSINLLGNLKINLISTTNNLTPGGIVAFDVPISGSKNITINSAHPIQDFGISTSGQVQSGVALRKANTYVGTTTVEQGALQIINSTSLGNSANTLNLGVAGSDSAALMTGATMTVANPIVVASGNSGTLTIDNASTSASVVVTFSGDITLGSNVNIYSRSTAENLIFTGVISGSGGVILPVNSQNGRISFRGANTYAGDTVINGQTLVARFGTAIPNGPSTGNVIMGGGTLELRASETINGLSGSGTVTSGAASTLTLGDNDATSAFSGAIVNGSGTSLTKIGSGTQTLSGTNTYAGTTTVNAGTLLVNGTNSGGGAYSVASGATLGGTGSIGASVVTVDAGGFLAPGASIESFDVGGATINGTLPVEYQGAVGAGNDMIDLLNVAGALDITNATLNLSSLGGTLDDGALVFAKYGSLAGTQFSSITGLLPLNCTIDYAYNDGASSNNIALVQVPEPCSLGLVVVMLLGLCVRRSA